MYLFVSFGLGTRKKEIDEGRKAGTCEKYEGGETTIPSTH